MAFDGNRFEVESVGLVVAVVLGGLIQDPG
jgi:hypothetical protein